MHRLEWSLGSNNLNRTLHFNSVLPSSYLKVKFVLPRLLRRVGNQGLRVNAGQSGSMRVNAGRSGSKWVKAGQCGTRRVKAGPCGSMRVHAGQCGSMRVNAGQCGSMRVEAGQKSGSRLGKGHGKRRFEDFVLARKQRF